MDYDALAKKYGGSSADQDFDALAKKYGGAPAAKEPEPEGSDLVRGFTSYLPQLKETLGGAQVLAGKALGSEDIMRAGIERMHAAKEELKSKYKETDSFTKALDKGIGAVLTDWLPYQVGSGAANLVESLAVMGAGMTLGSTVPGLGTAAGGTFGLLEKELVKKGVKEAAEKITKEMGEEAAKKFTEDQIKVAAKTVAKKVAGTTALAAQAGFHGAGETTSRAVEEAERLGKDATDIEMGRVLPAAIVHATAEFIGDKIGLGAFSKLDSPTKNLLLNFSKNLLVTGTKEAPVEVVQSMAERFGAKLSLSDAEAVKEYIDSAAAAYAMSVVPSAGGAVKGRGEAIIKEDIARRAEEAKAKQEAGKADEEAAKIGTTAVPGPEGAVEIPTFSPLGGENVKQPAGPVDGAGQPSAVSTTPAVETAAGESGAPDTTRVVPTGGTTGAITTAEGVQPAALNTIPYDTVQFAGEGQPLTRSSGSAEIINYGGRMIVMRNVNGVMLPFYLSTGVGGKSDVASGKWYPFFGIGADGWINKTDAKGMNSYYGSEALKQAAEELDNTIGDIRDDASIPKVSGTGRHINFINQGLNPTENKKADTLTKVRENIARVISAVEGEKDVTKPAAIEQPAVTEPVAVGQSVAEPAEGATPEAVVEPVSTTVVEEEKEPATTEVAKPVKEKKDYAATERVFSREQTPFVRAKVSERSGIPTTIDEAANYAAAETAFDFYDSAEPAVDQQLEAMAQEQGKTVDEVAAAMPEQQLFNMFYENVNTEGLSQDRQEQVEARDAFIKTLTPEQQAAVRKKAIEAFHTEIRAKRSGKRITDADKRKLRERTYNATEAKRILRAKKKAEATVKEAEKEPTSKERKEVSQKLDDRRENKVREAVKTGDINHVLKTISDPRLNDSITAELAGKLAKILEKSGITPNVIVGKVKGENVAQYDPDTDTITIDLDKLGTQRADIVVLHETMHHLADWAVDNPNSLSPEQKRALTELKNLYNHVNAFLGDKYAIGSLKEFIAQAFSNPEFQIAMGHLPPIKQTNALKEFAKQIMRMLGFRDRLLDGAERAELKGMYGATLGDVLSQIEIIISGPRSGVASGVSYMSKPAGPVKDETFHEMTQHMQSQKKPSIFNYVKQLFTTPRGTETLVRKFQNDTVAIKRWEDRLKAMDVIESYDDGFNNVYEQLVLASGDASLRIKQDYQADIDDMYAAIGDYAKKYNVDIDQALKDLGLIAIGQHYNERRKTLYILNVPLSDVAVPELQYKGAAISPYEYRKIIINILENTKFDPKNRDSSVKALREGLESLVFAPNNKYLSREKKDADKLDINNTKYDPAGAYTENELATIDKEYQARKADVDKVLSLIKKINKTNLKLGEESNYLSPYAKNIIDFYGWNSYVPLKGKGNNKEEVDLLNFDSQALGGELQEADLAMGGRITDPDNPILQVMADGVKSALRLSRKNLTESIYNAVSQGLIDGDIKKLTFNDRRNVKDLSEYRQESNIFHYMPDGVVAVVTIKDVNLRKAIRRDYKERNPLIDRANSITSFFGQLHTRYNASFAPVNFNRDVLTNAFTLGAELGPSKTFQFISSVAVDLGRGQYKAGNFARLYNKGDINKIRELAKKDNYYKELLEYVKTGAKVEHISGLSPKGQYEDLYKAAATGKILTTKKEIDKLFDMWIDSFELSARLAAYKTAKSTEKARLLAKGKSEEVAENGARVRAAAYAKNLANFEQMGEWGKQMGAAFMFFRPAATGAVRAMEAIAPAFMDVRQAMYRTPEYAEAANLRSELKTNKYEGEAKEKREKRLAQLEKMLKSFEDTYTQRKDNARLMTYALMGIGAAVYYMARGMADDDDLGRNKVSTDDMSRWTRFARFFLPGADKPLQVAWGFGLGALPALGAQLASIGDTNTKLADTLGNMVIISIDSFLPLPVSRISPSDKPVEFVLDTAMPSVVRPILEYALNLDGLGRQIYNNRQSRYGDAYTGGDNIPDIYKKAAGQWLDSSGNDVTPNVLYFFANNYADGVAKIFEMGYNLKLLAYDEKEFNWKSDTLFLNSFVGAKSNFDARQWQKISDDLKDRQRMVNMLKTNNPEKYADYLAAHPLDQILVNMYGEDINGHLRDLVQKKNEFSAMPGLSPKDKKSIVEAYNIQINLEKYRLVQLYKAMGVEP